jgi:hypothetical protein
VAGRHNLLPEWVLALPDEFDGCDKFIYVGMCCMYVCVHVCMCVCNEYNVGMFVSVCIYAFMDFYT